MRPRGFEPSGCGLEVGSEGSGSGSPCYDGRRKLSPAQSRPGLREIPGKEIVLGVLDLGSREAETPEIVADRIRSVLTMVLPERVVVAPDGGMKYLPRERTFRKLGATVAGARLVRDDLGL